MAGMFFSVQEAIEKLNVTEDQLQQLVKDGKLREFRVGTNLSYKVEEVEALMTTPDTIPFEDGKPADEDAMLLEVTDDEPGAEAEPAVELEPAGDAMFEIEPEEEAEPVVELQPVEETQPAAEVEPAAEAEPASEPEPLVEAEPAADIQPVEEAGPVIEAEPAAEELAEVELVEEPEAEPAAVDELADDTGGISLVSEEPSEVPQHDTSELLGLDSFASGEGLEGLGGTGGAAEGTDDTLAGLVDGTAAEPSLEEIEEDVNLDTFGSGSGLLDLSLQADDTSLGGILDEIYTAEGEQETSESAALDMGDEEAAPMLPVEEDLAAVEEEAPIMPVAAAVAVEAPPDAVSNAMGWMMFLPLVAIILAAVFAVSGSNDVKPGLLTKLESFGSAGGIHVVWFVMGGLLVVSGLVAGAGSMAGGGGGEKKPKKPKKPKEPKKKKEKKPKKPKEPKKKKEKKPKKPKKKKK